MKPIIAPSILSADFGYLAKDIEMVNRSEAEWVHIDIMDGVFVPNISFGFPVLKYVAKLSQKPLDVHLMIVNPEKFIPEVKALGAHTMNVHYEACPHLHRAVSYTHLRAHETDSYLVCRLLLEKKKRQHDAVSYTKRHRKG